MAEKLVITFNAAVTEKYLEMAADKTRSEVDADCCPSGVSILAGHGVRLLIL